jgi:pyruvate/2-oxoglutarate dehydrogenase complex dihydrolipoamide dehydrogenase (E3) component
MIDVLVIGAGPAGVLAALRAADLGARTVLLTRTEFGGMAANDGPVPVRTLAHAARLIREARQLGDYGIGVSEPVLDYPRLLARVREAINDVRAHSSLRPQIDSLGVTVHEHAGVARFADEHTIETKSGLRLRAEKIIICTGGVSRRLSVPGFELTNTHSDAWGLTSVPPSMLVVGAGATGVQLARESSSSKQAPASCRARMKMYRQRLRQLSAARTSRSTRISALLKDSRKRRLECG